MSIRIVGGEARGRLLKVPADGTRPTSERARAALFDRLDTLLDLDGAVVLDLYAGSGALGLEAVSRGAHHAVLVDSDRRAVELIQANAAVVSRPGVRVVALCRDAGAYTSGTPGQPFDAVFLDPPYALSDDVLSGIVGRLSQPAWTTTGSVVVVERSSRAAGPTWPTRVEALTQKRYGEATLWYGRVR